MCLFSRNTMRVHCLCLFLTWGRLPKWWHKHCCCLLRLLKMAFAKELDHVKPNWKSRVKLSVNLTCLCGEAGFKKSFIKKINRFQPQAGKLLTDSDTFFGCMLTSHTLTNAVYTEVSLDKTHCHGNVVTDIVHLWKWWSVCSPCQSWYWSASYWKTEQIHCPTSLNRTVRKNRTVWLRTSTIDLNDRWLHWWKEKKNSDCHQYAKMDVFNSHWPSSLWLTRSDMSNSSISPILERCTLSI